MKLFQYIFFFLSIYTYSQKVIVEKVKKLSSPTQTITYIDSLLFHNSHIDKVTKKELVYLQALAYQENNNDKKALELFDQALSFTDKNKKRYVKILLFQSNSNVKLKNISIATEQALKAIEQARINKSPGLIAAGNNALSFIYYSNKQYQKSFDYLFNSVKLQKEEKDSVRLSATYNNIAIIYKKIGDFNKALEYNNKSLDLSKLINNYIGIGKSFSNIGRVYELQNDNKNALSYYHKALENNKKHKIINSIPYRNIADIYFKEANYQEAEKYFLLALDIEKKNNNNIVLSVIYEGLLKIAIRREEYNKALSFQIKVDSINQINIQHENKEKNKVLENQYKLFQSKKELKQALKINNKNRIIFGVLISLAFLVLLLIVLKNRNTKLVNEQERLRLEQRVLRSQMNPHFIFNALSAIQNSLLDNDPLKSASYLSRFAKLIRQNFDFINQKKILLAKELDALKNYMDTQKMRFNDKFDYEINIFADVDINSVEIPPLLLQPLVENAIEHGFKNKKNGLISINISKKLNNICYEIKDNGSGFSTQNKDNKLHALDILKKRLKLLNNKDADTFTMQSTDKGTTIYFCLAQ